MESPEKRRLGTFGSAGSINYPDRKAYPEGHPLRQVPGATRHSSLGDHKTLETEALAEVRLVTDSHFLHLTNIDYTGICIFLNELKSGRIACIQPSTAYLPRHGCPSKPIDWT